MKFQKVIKIQDGYFSTQREQFLVPYEVESRFLFPNKEIFVRLVRLDELDRISHA